MPIITVENLKYRYPNTKRLALDSLSFTVERGEFLGLIGENGAGKSTLCQALIGLVPQFHKGAYGGRVLVDGQEAAVTPVAQLCRSVGLVFQNPFNQLSGAKDTVYEEVAFGMQNLGIEREEMHRRARQALERLGIWAYRDRNPFDLSGGQMQRVAIASVLVMQPKVIVLDEPTSQLDPQGTQEVFRAVEELAAGGITIVMAEQKIEQLAAHCGRLLLLHEGKLAACDTPRRVFSLENWEQYGVQAPVFTRVCRALEKRLPDGTYPVTAAEAAQALGKTVSESGGAANRKNVQQEGALPETPSYIMTPAGTWESSETFQLREVSFGYRPQAKVLDGLALSLDARPTAIIGQNGAGKTTLVKLLKGLLKPQAGTICFREEDVADKTVAAMARYVGYVFQNPDDQIFKYKVLDEVMFGPLNIGMSEEEAKKAALAALREVGLEGREQDNPYDLELYERKMTAIASVLAMRTDVLILDEPTIAQDERGRARIGGMIQRLAENGRLVIAVLHDMDFVAEYFERVIVMAHGRVVADGSAAQVFAQREALEAAALERPYAAQLGGKLGLDAAVLTAGDLIAALRSAAET